MPLAETRGRAIRATLAVAAALTGLVGVAHTRAGRPLLVALAPVARAVTGGRSACPLGYDAKATPAQRDAARAAFARVHRGAEPARARPALGFTLDATTRADVLAWAASRGARCRERAGAGADIECRDVPEALLPGEPRGAPVSSLWLTFGGAGTLTSVVAVRNDRRAEVIRDAFAAATSGVARAAGPASTIDGHGTVLELSAGPLAQSTAEYRFADYYALARAANVGGGFVMTEEYRSLAD